MENKDSIHSLHFTKYILMELLFPRDDEINYGKECNNKNWATEDHECFSCSFCNISKNHVVPNGEEHVKSNYQPVVPKTVPLESLAHSLKG